jgi:DnaK suppressor protein
MPRPQSSTRRRAELLETLLERRRQLLSDVNGRMREVRARSYDERERPDDNDGQEADIQADIELAVIQMKSETLRRIDAALERLAEGTYGDCVSCGGAIPAERLKALPFAVRCTRCEQAREAVQRRSPATSPERLY